MNKKISELFVDDNFQDLNNKGNTDRFFVYIGERTIEHYLGTSIVNAVEVRGGEPDEPPQLIMTYFRPETEVWRFFIQTDKNYDPAWGHDINGDRVGNMGIRAIKTPDKSLIKGTQTNDDQL